MPKLKNAELIILKKALDDCLYWFDRERLFSFLSTLKRHDTDQVDRLRRRSKISFPH